MVAAYVVVTVLAAAMNGWAASADYSRPAWLIANMEPLGVPQSQLPVLGALKALGALGLLVGLAVPAVGVAAGAGLTLYFVGAVATVGRAGQWEQWYPWMFLALSAGALALRVVV